MAILINIDVPSLVAGITFYESALGMKLVRLIDDDVAEMVRDGAKFYLLQKNEFSSFSTSVVGSRSYFRHWTPVHIDFVVDSLDEAKQVVIKAGAVMESDCVEWRGSRCITFSDPFGHGFCLIEFSNKIYSSDEP